jgi:hypothetical protein
VASKPSLTYEEAEKRLRALDKRAAQLTATDRGQGLPPAQAEPLRRQQMAELDVVLAEMQQLAPQVQAPQLRAVDQQAEQSMKATFTRRMNELLHREFREDHPEVVEREQEIARLAAIDAAKKKRQLVKARKIWIPVGRDSESADVIAAVFGSQEFAEWTDASRPGGAGFEPDDTLSLLWALTLIAENRGNPVEFHFSRRPRKGILNSYSDERMRHLAATAWLTYETKGAIRRIGLGSRTERLRREFREACIARGKEELKIEAAAKRKVKAATGE